MFVTALIYNIYNVAVVLVSLGLLSALYVYINIADTFA